MAKAKPDHFAVFLSRAKATGFHRVVAAVSFAARSSPEIGPFAVDLFVPFGLCRPPICFATADFAPASDPVGSAVVVAADLAAAAAVVVAAAAVAAAGLF